MNRWTNNYYGQSKGGDVLDYQSRSAVVTGGASAVRQQQQRPNSDSRLNEKVAHLLVYRVVHLTEVTLRSFIERQGIPVLKVQQVSREESMYKSFLVTVRQDDAAALLHRTFWPGLVACRLLGDGGEVLGSSTFFTGPPVTSQPKHAQVSGWARVQGRTDSTFSNKTIPVTETQRLLPYQTAIQVSSGSLKNSTRTGSKDKDRESPHIRNKMKVGNRKRVNGMKSGIRKISTNVNTDRKVKQKENTLGDEREGKNVQGNVKHRQKNKSGNKHNSAPERTSVKHGLLKKEDENVHDENKDLTGGRERREGNKSEMAKEKGQRKASHKTKNRKSTQNINGEKPKGDKFGKTKGKSSPNKTSKDGGPMSKHINGRNWNSGPKPHDLPRKDATKTNTNIVTIRKDNKDSQEEKFTNWDMSLRKLLILAPEEAVSRLIILSMDEALSQDYINNDELFPGIKVLAHSARAESSPDTMKKFVYKICQPQIVNLFKTFSVTVERQYPERAESYFWNLG
nr:LOW QUALITY PROTEIN: uncharacterized protein LOC128698670 [Cherax quadricarinatus]